MKVIKNIFQGAEKALLFPVAALQPAQRFHPGERKDDWAAEEQGRPLTTRLRSLQRKLKKKKILGIQRKTIGAFKEQGCYLTARLCSLQIKLNKKKICGTRSKDDWAAKKQGRLYSTSFPAVKQNYLIHHSYQQFSKTTWFITLTPSSSKLLDSSLLPAV